MTKTLTSSPDAAAIQRAHTNNFTRRPHFILLLSIAIFLSLFGSVGSIPEQATDQVHFRTKVPTTVPSLNLERANRVLKETPLIDGHNDLLIVIRLFYLNHIYGEEFRHKFEDGGFQHQVDIPRLAASKMGGTFWNAFMPCPKNGSLDFADENYDQVVRGTLQQLDLFHRMSSQYPEYFNLITSAQKAQSAFRDGCFVALLAIEGLHQIGNSPSLLRLYYALGVRYATLTWNCHNAYADAALIEVGDSDGGNTVSVPATPYWGGVSPAGQDLIAEMNRLGMIVDLAHVSADTMRQVLEGSSSSRWKGSLAPPIFSHSSAYAICPHPRNVPDDVLHMVKRRNSLVMVNFNPRFISCVKSEKDPQGLPTVYAPNATRTQVVRHIMYIGNLIGYDHVGLGSDFDGIDAGPEGLEDVSRYPDLVAELLDNGVSEEDCGKVVGGNLLRVWKQVQEVAAQLRMSPLEDDMEKVWLLD